MDRNALLLYLRDLRDLEIAKRKIEFIISSENKGYSKKLSSINKPNLVTIPEKESGWTIGKVLGTIFCLGFGIFGTLLYVYMMLFGTTTKATQKTATINGITTNNFIEFKEVPIGINPFMVIMTIGTILITLNGLFIAFHAIYETHKNKKRIIEAQRYNDKEFLRIKGLESTATQVQQQWQQRASYLNSELNKVSSLLKAYYNLNILANQYRNLASIYYIYDYMSSSQESLKDTLIHEHMENGIQRILQKLDYIIEQNQEVIFQTRILEAENKKIIEQNEGMLRSLRQIEINTAEAAQYAEISANYSKTNAFFNYANYLRN